MYPLAFHARIKSLLRVRCVVVLVGEVMRLWARVRNIEARHNLAKTLPIVPAAQLAPATRLLNIKQACANGAAKPDGLMAADTTAFVS